MPHLALLLDGPFWVDRFVSRTYGCSRRDIVVLTRYIYLEQNKRKPTFILDYMEFLYFRKSHEHNGLRR